MFAMGDEVRRTQQGNNNAYCQDNATSWFDWTLVSKHADVLRFVKCLIDRRVTRDLEHERCRVSLSQVLRESNYAWHGVRLNQPDWSSESHAIAINGELKNEAMIVHVIFNAYWEPLEFELPVLKSGSQRWSRWIDTAQDPPHEISEFNKEEIVPERTYRVGARSVVVLIAAKVADGIASTQ